MVTRRVMSLNMTTQRFAQSSAVALPKGLILSAKLKKALKPLTPLPAVVGVGD